MSTQRSFARAGAVLTVSGVVALLGSGTAAAHVTANTGGEPAEKGGHSVITFRVPNEEPDANTVRLDVTFPQGTPISSAQTKPIPGWTAKVQKARLDRPVTTKDGARITEAVTKITWTARPGDGGLSPDQYGEFDASVTMPDNTDIVVFPAMQHYDNGKVVNWKTPPPPDGEQEPEHPAPFVELSEPSGGHGHGGHGGSSSAGGHEGHGAAEKSGDGASDSTARWLGGIGLVVGALGLGLGGGAVLRSRKAGGQSSGGGGQA